MPDDAGQISLTPPTRLRRSRTSRTAPRTAADAFEATALRSLDEIDTAAEGFRQAPGPERLHELRVALRRWRSVLSAYEPLLARRRAGEIVSQARWVFRELNEARDLDVLARRLPKARGADLDGRLAAARALAYQRALSAVRSDRFDALVAGARFWVRSKGWSGTGRKARRLQEESSGLYAARVLERLRRRVKAGGRRFRRLDDEDLHRLRLNAKTLRYACEVLPRAEGETSVRPRRLYLRRAKALQDGLGELNDVTVGRKVAARALPGPAPDLGRGRGRKALRKAARHAFKALRRAERFWN